MLEIKCPKCQVLIGGWLADYIQWRSDRRKCPNCGALLEISNGIICFGLCGLIFGALFASSNYWPFARAMSLVLVVVLCWTIMPIIVRTLGRWRVSTSGTAVSMKARKWSGVVHISGWVFAIAVIATFVIFGLQYKDLLADAVDMAISGGEHARDIYHFRDLLFSEAFDTVQPDVILGNPGIGMTGMRRVAETAKSVGKLIVPHVYTGGVCGLALAATLQVLASVSNCSYVEYPLEPPALTVENQHGLLKEPILIEKDGYVRVPQLPGIGVEIDEEYIDKYL